MFSSSKKLSGRALRTASELKDQVPVGATCWIIGSGANQRPSSVFQVQRTSDTSYTSIESCDDEEDIKLCLTESDILGGMYGGAWLNKEDALNYFKLLEEFWEQAPKVIAKVAEETEEKTVH
jgi:hypothetical protein